MSVDIYKVAIADRQKVIKVPIGLRLLIRRCCNAILRLENFKGSAEVSVTIVDNSYIQSLNKQYRDKDNPTDVLSFPRSDFEKFNVNPETKASILGDIVISLEKAEEQSKVYGHSLQKEVASLVIHGMFHLLGYDHEKNDEDRLVVIRKEEIILESVGV